MVALLDGSGTESTYLWSPILHNELSLVSYLGLRGTISAHKSPAYNQGCVSTTTKVVLITTEICANAIAQTKMPLGYI